MDNYIMVIDGGTTSTVFTLLKNDRIVSVIKKKAGAVDAVSTDGIYRNRILEKAVISAIEEFESNENCQITSILASGMISSEVGLKEIRHLEAPVTFEKLASNIKPQILDVISEDISFFFVPGIKFNADSLTLMDIDIIRGEETDIFGAMYPEDYNDTIVFLHFGSNDRAVLYKDKAITDGVTTISGDLLRSMVRHSILKSVINPDFIDLLDASYIDEEYVKSGFLACGKAGLTRALFSTRIGKVIKDLTNSQSVSYICGALINSDLQAFDRLLSPLPDKIIMYGRDSFMKAFKICIDAFRPELSSKIREISFIDSQNLSVKGLIMLYDVK